MKKNKNLYILSFMIPVIIMLFVIYYGGFLPFGSKSLMAIDFSQQFVDFFIFFKNRIFSGDIGNFFYSFSKSLGGNFIGVWSYYLNSPLNFLYVLTPLKYIDYTTVLIILIRYGLMGLTFTHFLVKRHGGAKVNRYLVLALASAYALNGYNVSYQVVPIFYDAFWLLPLVIIGLEELLDGENPLKYILLLAATIFIQYYMGYMICLFIIFYSVFYLISKRRDEKWGDYIRFMVGRLVKVALCSVLSIGLISFIFIPNVMNLLGSKATGNPMRFEWKLQIKPLDILSKFFIGAFDNTSWPAGPNLPNIFVGSLAMAGAGVFFTSKEVKRETKRAAGVILFIFFLSMVHEFTSKIWHMGQNPAGFFYRFSWLVCFFLIYLAYLGLRNVREVSTVFVCGAFVILAAAAALVLKQEQSFMKPYQIVMTIIFFLVVLLLLYSDKTKDRWLLILTLTVVELGANTYISQKDLPYNNSYKFSNAVEVIGEAIDRIRPGDDEFYRISKSFTRSKNDPLSLDYPGLTHFSSNLELNTREFMDDLGNNSVDMTTFYMGTPLTDALFSVKYYITNADYRVKSNEESERTYFFGEDVERPDLVKDENLVGSTERFFIYEIRNILPVAFGTRDSILSVPLVKTEPVDNQEMIARSLEPAEGTYFTEVPLGITDVADVIPQGEGTKKYRTSSENKEGRLTYKFTPDTDDPYYMVLPRNLSDHKNELSIFLNGRSIKLRRKFTVDQLVTVADNVKGQEQSIEIRFTRKEPVDMEGFKVVKLDMNKVNNLINKRKAQGLKVTKWGSNYINGTVNITDDSTMMLTSIPYESGWQVKVDGQKVEPQEVWGALMAFPVTSGEHDIRMTYISPGFIQGLVLSLLSLIALFFLIRQNPPEILRKRKALKQKEFRNATTQVSDSEDINYSRISSDENETTVISDETVLTRHSGEDSDTDLEVSEKNETSGTEDGKEESI